MIFQNIYNDIARSFNGLWKYKERGKSLEIISPFVTTSQKFVSVFLTEREGEYIVSDGAWIAEGLYENPFDRTIDCFEKIIQHYKNSCGINETYNLNKASVFFKKTSSIISVPSLVLDLCNFVCAIVSISNVEFADKEIDNQNRFNQNARNFLQRLRPKKSWDEWHFNEYLDSKREVRPSAILRKKNSNVVLLNFITGSNYNYFRTNISRANMIFELADKSNES